MELPYFTINLDFTSLICLIIFSISSLVFKIINCDIRILIPLSNYHSSSHLINNFGLSVINPSTPICLNFSPVFNLLTVYGITCN
ncbi:hypothetical protein C7Q01_09690 [Staphylococcus aureus]|nr:hypothetical protein C7Q01_09690 [Staphylococcus aureus]